MVRQAERSAVDAVARVEAKLGRFADRVAVMRRRAIEDADAGLGKNSPTASIRCCFAALARVQAPSLEAQTRADHLRVAGKVALPGEGRGLRVDARAG